MRIRLNWPLAIVLCVLFVSSLGTWLALVLAKIVPVESGWTLLSHFGTLLAGSLVPLLTYWREKKISFEVSDSDPPATPNNTGERKP